MNRGRISSLSEAFLYYTDCQVATVECLRSRKSTSQSALRRQISIAEGMLSCAQQYIADGELADELTRIAARLADATEPQA